MKFKRKPAIVEAFCFDKDSEITAPGWFQKEVEKEKIFIDRCITDGAVRVYGCTIHTKFGRVKAKVGDHIILEPSGAVRPCKAKEFKETYERVRNNGGQIHRVRRAEGKGQTEV